MIIHLLHGKINYFNEKKNRIFFFEKYINDLSQSLNQIDKKSLNKAANEILKYLIKIQFLFVVMEDLQLYQIIIFVTI